MNTGERIKQAREAAGLTQTQLADRLGVKHSAISKYECGRVVNLKRETIGEIARVLNVKPSWLMCMEDKPTEVPVYLSENENTLIALFRELNDEGQEKIFEYLSDLTDTGKYQKGLTASVGV